MKVALDTIILTPLLQKDHCNITQIKTSDLTIFGTDDVLGQVGGNSHTQKGGGVNYLCLPSDPENGYPLSYDNDQVFGAEYQIFSSNKPAGMSPLLGDTEVPCAVCHRKQKSSVLMIPGKFLIKHT